MHKSNKDTEYFINRRYNSGEVDNWKKYSFYKEDYLAPSKWSQLLNLNSNPYWFYTVMTLAYVQSIYVIQLSLDGATINYYSSHISAIRFATWNVQLIYAIDIGLAIWTQYFHKKRSEITYVHRPIWIMLFEIVSVIPFNYFAVPKKGGDGSLYYTVSLTQSFKIARVLYQFRLSNIDCYELLKNSLIKIAACYMAIMYITASIMQQTMCSRYMRNACFSNVSVFVLDIVTNKVVGKSGLRSEFEFPTLKYELPMIALNTLMGFWFFYPTIAWLVLVFVRLNKHRFEFVFVVAFFKQYVATKYIKHAGLYNQMLKVFEARWAKRDGYQEAVERELRNANTFLLHIDVAMDRMSPMFLHSLIFSELDIETLRRIAPLVKRELYCAGEYIYERNVVKNSMFYIASGVVDVITNENAESAILAFTDGTCIGVANLIIPSKSIVDFKCKSVVEVFVLDRKDFVMNAREYVNGYNFVRQKVMERYEKAKRLQQGVVGKKTVYDLKNTLHAMSSKTHKLRKKHEVQNIFLRDKAIRRKRTLVTVEYLPCLAIEARTETDIDLVFQKQTFLWILKPNSPIMKLWSAFVCIMALYAMILIPYSCIGEMTDFKRYSLDIIFGCWVLDIFLEFITLPVDCRKGTINTVIEIIGVKMNTKEFLFDVICIFPARFFNALFRYDTPYLEIPRMMKLYRIVIGVRSLYSKPSVNMMYHSILKVFFIYALFVFFCPLLFTVLETRTMDTIAFFVQVLTGSGLDFKFYYPEPNTYDNILRIAATFVEIGVTVSVMGVVYLHVVMMDSSERLIRRITQVISSKKVPFVVMKVTESFFNAQMDAFRGVTIETSVTNMLKMNERHSKLLNSQFHYKELLKLKLFAGIPNAVVMALAGKSSCLVVNAGGIIIDRGFVEDEVFVIMSGVTQSVVGKYIYVTPPGSVINLLEAAFKTPSVVTVHALTDVMLISFSFKTFLNLLRDYPEHLSRFANVIKTCEQIRSEMWKILRGVHVIVVRSKMKYANVISFNAQARFGTFDAFDYFVPFDKLWPFDWVRHFLMKRTFKPHGTFWKVWEYTRCAVLIVSTAVFIHPRSARVQILSMHFVTLQIFNAYGIIDMYLRFHLCYYNSDGLLVSHPLSTAKYYLTRNFAIDLFFAMPFNLIFFRKVSVRAVLNVLCALQLYRVIGLKRLKTQTRIVYAVYCSLLLFFIYYIISVLLYIYFYWPLESNTKIVGKYSESHILYLVSSIGLGTGMPSSMNIEFLNIFRLPLMFLTVPLIMVRILFFSLIFTRHLRLHSQWNFYLSNLRCLLKCMKKHKVHSHIRRETIKYYDEYWLWLGNKNLFMMLKQINRALRIDILFAFYSAHLVETAIFDVPVHQLREFYKNILIKFHPCILPRRAPALSINDVNSYIYFIYKGSMEVVAPDGTTIVHLHDGAIFGNLEDVKMSRQKVSVIANNKVMLFYMNTQTFYDIMNFFPNVKNEFMRNRRDDNFIESANREPYQPKKVSRANLNIYKLYALSTKFHALLICYIAVLYDFFDIGMNIASNPYMIAVDALHAVHLIMKFFVYIKDENDDFITDRLRNTKALQIVIATLTVLPFNLIHISLHYNRFLRLYYYFAFCFQKLKVLSNGMKYRYRIGFLFSQVILYYSVFAYITGPKCMSVLDFEFKAVTSKEHLELYLRYYYFAVMLLWSQNDYMYYPRNTEVVIFLFYVTFAISVIIFSQVYEIVTENTYNYMKFYETVEHYKHFITFSQPSTVLKNQIQDEHIRTWRRMHQSLYLLDYNSPEYIRAAFYNSVVGHLFRGNPVFCNAHVDFLRQLQQHVEINVYNSKVIIRKQDVKTCMYLILSGEVMVYDSNCLVLQVLNAGDAFGIKQGLNYHEVFDYTYRAYKDCEIVEVELRRWEYLLPFFPASKETIYSAAQYYYDLPSCISNIIKISKKKKR